MKKSNIHYKFILNINKFKKNRFEDELILLNIISFYIKKEILILKVINFIKSCIYLFLFIFHLRIE